MARKKIKKKSKKLKNTLIKDILRLFAENPGKTFNYKQICAALNIKDSGIRRLTSSILIDLSESGRIKEVERGKYKAKHNRVYVTGVIEMTAKGSAFVITNETEEDIFIAQKNVNQSLHGDEVKVYLFAKRSNRKPEGEVVEVLSRARTEFVGIVSISKKFAFLTPDNHRIHVDLFIPLQNLNGAKDGQKAIAKITDWPQKSTSPIGEITQVLGNPGENDVEMHAIMADYNLPYKFPFKVERFADNVSTVISKEEIQKRRDFRKTTTFTIDPEDAKDFDDALSVKKLKNGIWEIGIHIADVSHYVTPGSPIEKEAVKRATSVYLVDRVVPMLPEVLSNQVCSLRPNEEKLCFSAVFELNKEGQVLSEWFGKTVIYSDRRFTYEEAQETIETGKGDLAEEILLLNEIAVVLRKQRIDNGALSLISREVKFKLDDKGNPIETFFKEAKDSNKLIEEYMLLANRKVAARIGKPEKGKTVLPFVYRVHDNPDKEKLEDLAKFVKKFGHELDLFSEDKPAGSINQLLHSIAASGENDVIQRMVIRSMAKAIYTTENNGHFGLAFDYYSHFTSPIRRYPDLIVHRLLFQYLNNEKGLEEKKLEFLCKHCSTKERKAAEVERMSIKFMQVVFMQNRLGEEFEGVISGLTDWGIYVELTETKCEGMVRLQGISDDHYHFDEENYQIVGNNYGRKFNLGDTINVRVTNADLMRKQLDFEMAEDY
jgi:ribonuclease R